MKKLLSVLLALAMALSLCSLTTAALAAGNSGAIYSEYQDLDIDLSFVWYDIAQSRTVVDLGDEIDLSMVTNSSFDIRIAANIRNMGRRDFTSTTLELTDGEGSAVWRNDLIEAGEGYYYSSGKLSGYAAPGTYTASVIIDGQTVRSEKLTIIGRKGGSSMTCFSQLITRNVESGNTNHVLSGNTIALSDMPEDNYLSLRLTVNNNTSSKKSLTVYAMLDGNRISYNDATVDAHDYWCFNIGQNTMAKYGVGDHTILWYVNDECVASQSFTVTETAAAGASTASGSVFSRHGDMDLDLCFVWYNIAESRTEIAIGDVIDLAEVTNPSFDIRIAANIRNMGRRDFTSTTLELTDGEGSAVWRNDLVEAGEGYYYSSGKLSGYAAPGTYTAQIIIDGKVVCEQPLTITGRKAGSGVTYFANIITRNIDNGNTNHVLSGNTVDQTAIPEDNYLSLRLTVNNNTSSSMSLSVYAMLDGNRVDWNGATVSAHDYWCFNIGQNTMARYGVGEHTAVWYVNDERVLTQTFVITDGEPAAAAPTVPATLADRFTAETMVAIRDVSNDEFIGNSHDQTVAAADYPSGTYFAPRMLLTNNTGAVASLTVSAEFDGKSVSWSPSELAVGETRSFSMNYRSMADFQTGTHSIVWYVDGEEIARHTYTIADPAAAQQPAAQQPAAQQPAATVELKGATVHDFGLTVADWMSTESRQALFVCAAAVDYHNEISAQLPFCLTEGGVSIAKLDDVTMVAFVPCLGGSYGAFLFQEDGTLSYMSIGNPDLSVYENVVEIPAARIIRAAAAFDELN